MLHRKSIGCSNSLAGSQKNLDNRSLYNKATRRETIFPLCTLGNSVPGTILRNINLLHARPFVLIRLRPFDSRPLLFTPIITIRNMATSFHITPSISSSVKPFNTARLTITRSKSSSYYGIYYFTYFSHPSHFVYARPFALRNNVRSFQF